MRDSTLGECEKVSVHSVVGGSAGTEVIAAGNLSPFQTTQVGGRDAEIASGRPKRLPTLGTEGAQERSGGSLWHTCQGTRCCSIRQRTGGPAKTSTSAGWRLRAGALL